MNNFSIVFSIIKAHCEETGVVYENCFTEPDKPVIGNRFFIPLYLYLEVLQSLGLIALRTQPEGIILTEEGKNAGDDLVFGSHAFALLFLFCTRDIFLFILFWPVLIMAQKAYGREEEKNSAG